MLPRNYLLLTWLEAQCPRGRGVPRALGTDLRTPLLPAQLPPSWLCPEMPAVGSAPLLRGGFGARSWGWGGSGMPQAL